MTEFFWMSAQVWWLATVRRIAREVDLTDAQVDRLRAVATNQDWPHALLRELARRTLLDLDLDRDYELLVLNQPGIELFFSILQRKVIRNGDFQNREDLITKLMRFIADYDQTTRPFAWTYSGQPLKVA